MSPETPPLPDDPPKDASIPRRTSRENPKQEEIGLEHLAVGPGQEDSARQLEVISGFRFRDERDRQQFTSFMESLAQALETYLSHNNAEPLAGIDDTILRAVLLAEPNEPAQRQKISIEEAFVRIQKNITEYLISHPRQIQISSGVISDQLILRIKGMESMVNFLHLRSAEPLPEDCRRTFYTQTRLDARFSVDVIEVIEQNQGGQLEIPELNLIQVKSSEPTDRGVSDIQKDHDIVWRELWGDVENANQAVAEAFRLSPDQLGKRVEGLLWICAELQAGGSPKNFLDSLTAEIINSAEQYGVNPDYLRQASPALRAKRITPILRMFLKSLGERFDKAFVVLDQMSKKPEGVPPQQPFFVRNPAVARIKDVNSLVVVGERSGSYHIAAKEVITSGQSGKALVLRSRRIDPGNKKR